MKGKNRETATSGEVSGLDSAVDMGAKHNAAEPPAPDLTEFHTCPETLPPWEEKERYFRELVEKNRDGIFRTDLEGRFIGCNARYAAMLGYPLEELRRLTDMDLTPEKWREWEKTEIVEKQILQRGYSNLYEKEYRCKDGTVFPVELQVYLIRDAAGLAVGMWGFVRDITQRKRAEAVIHDSETRYRRLFETAQDGILILDGDTGRIMDVNPFLIQMLGFSYEELFGKELWEIGTFKDIAASKDAFCRLCEKGYIRYANLPLLTCDGRRIEVEFVSNVYREDHRKVIQCNIRDNTEHKKVEDQLHQAQKMESVGRLAGGVAHDFNNLLTSIAGNAQLLSTHHANDPEIGELVGEILKSSNRAADLTRQLLAFSRKGQLQSIPVNVHDVIADAINLLSHSLERRIDVVQRLSASQPVVMGDPTQLQSAILNLALNARDAMPDGGTLTFTTRDVRLSEDQCVSEYQELRPGSHVEISVSDTGVGMDSDVQEHLFEPFFTTKHPGRGTGLGLAGVYGCVQSHKGLILVSSQIGRGTMITILLPAVENQVSSGRSPHWKGAVKGRGCILVVDDEDGVRNFLVHSLEDLGYTVQACADGVEAVDFFHRNHDKIDLVILDLIMPKLDGEGAFRVMRRIDPNARILIASGFAQLRATDALLREGALGFVDKPFRIERLSHDLARYIAGGAPASP